MEFAILRRASCALACTLALFAFGAAPASAQQTSTFNMPQISGVPVDHCATWATDCGQGGANAYCRVQGYTRATSFQVYNPGRTYVIGSQRVCEGGNCVALSTVTCVSEQASNNGGTFTYPQVNGIAVDNCATWATNCGQGGADAFCRTQGYGGASSFALFNPGRTWVLGNQKVCEGGGCVGFSQVVCGAGAPPPPPGAAVLTGNWHGYSDYYFQQNGNTFTWLAPAMGETAQGTINGTSLAVKWTNAGGGGGEATGTITAFDSYGRATQIKWSNGQEMNRVN